MEINQTQEDFYHGVYSNWYLNTFTLCCYFFGLAGAAKLFFVTWFERSGEAGPYRTLVNQLASVNLDQASIHSQAS